MFARVGIEGDVLNITIAEPEKDPQLVGAIGAAVIAENTYNKKHNQKIEVKI